MKEKIANLLFFYIFCSSSLEKMNILDFDLNNFCDTLKSLKTNNNEEINLINIVIDNNLVSIKSFNYKAFSDVYGKKDCKNFTLNFLIFNLIIFFKVRIFKKIHI